MDWTALIGILLLAGLVALFVRQRRARRLTLARETVRCPVQDCGAVVALRADLRAQPGRRYVDVATCSLLPVTPIGVLTTTAYLSDVPTQQPYIREISQAPHHGAAVACSKPCLSVLNAAEHWAPVVPLRCASGVADGLELVRQTQGPAMMRLLWFHSN